tara:strand:- start:3362 stop:3847 length:486 start_codon:yes stop_codon:yes gene_type:complete
MTIQENLIIEVDEISKEMIILINNTDFEDKNNLKENNRNINLLIDRLKNKKKIYSDTISKITETERINEITKRNKVLIEKVKEASVEKVMSVIYNQVVSSESVSVNKMFTALKEIKDEDFYKHLKNKSQLRNMMKKKCYTDDESLDIILQIYRICRKNNLL